MASFHWRTGIGVGVGLFFWQGSAEIATSAIVSFVMDEPGPPLVMPRASLFRSNYPSFNSQRLDQQLELYAQYLAAYGPPDVLIVGSSRSLQGIDPTVLQAALAEQGYGEVQVYNFSINGATAQVVDLVLRRILTPEQLPRLILWGDGSRAFNNGRVDVTFNGIVASEGYRQLSEGIYPIAPPEPSSTPEPPLTLCFDPPGPLRLAQRSFSLRPCHKPEQLPLQPLSPAPLQGIDDLSSSGFRPVADQFDPTLYYQYYPKVPGNYDSDYVPFQLEGPQTEAAIALAHYMQPRHIPLVFVNLPLTQDYLDTTRQSYEQEFQRHMQALATQEGLIFRNLVGQWSTQNNYFADPSHLNHQGAIAVARHLTTDAAIPWAILNQPR